MDKKTVPTLKKRPQRVKSELEQQLELALSKKREAERKAAELQREIDDIPRKLKKLEDDERRRIKDRAAKTPTMQGLSRPAHKLQVAGAGLKLTRTQQRVMKNRFILLCIVFAAILLLLWKSIRCA